MRMDAYYFGFTPTGIEVIDRILSAVACAGKAYHHTESWAEPVEPYEDFLRGTTCAEWIQYAAADAASALKAQDEKIARLVEAAKGFVNDLASRSSLIEDARSGRLASLYKHMEETRSALAGAGKERGD